MVRRTKRGRRPHTTKSYSGFCTPTRPGLCHCGTLIRLIKGNRTERGYAVLRAYLQSIGEDIEDIDEQSEATRPKRKTLSNVVASKTSSQPAWMHNNLTVKWIIPASLQATTITHTSICLHFKGTAIDAFSTNLGQWRKLMYDQVLSWTVALALPADDRTKPPARAEEHFSYCSTLPKHGSLRWLVLDRKDVMHAEDKCEGWLQNHLPILTRKQR